jgi:hypothetical protein
MTRLAPLADEHPVRAQPGAYDFDVVKTEYSDIELQT